MVGGGYLATAYGCEAASAHRDGGSFAFIDGHSRWIARDSERYLKQRADGRWFKQYLTYSYGTNSFEETLNRRGQSCRTRV